jgi:hypothetical protein
MYHEYPCWWKVKSKDYFDRVEKNLAYEYLATKIERNLSLRQQRKIFKKINSLRICLRKELEKVNDLKTSGAGADDTYLPSLWYLQELLFITDQEVPRKGISNLESPEDTNHGEAGNNLSRSRTCIMQMKYWK